MSTPRPTETPTLPEILQGPWTVDPDNPQLIWFAPQPPSPPDATGSTTTTLIARAICFREQCKTCLVDGKTKILTVPPIPEDEIRKISQLIASAPMLTEAIAIQAAQLDALQDAIDAISLAQASAISVGRETPPVLSAAISRAASAKDLARDFQRGLAERLATGESEPAAQPPSEIIAILTPKLDDLQDAIRDITLSQANALARLRRFRRALDEISAASKSDPAAHSPAEETPAPLSPDAQAGTGRNPTSPNAPARPTSQKGILVSTQA